MSKYSSDPNAPPNFGGNMDDDDLNDRSMNTKLSYPTDVQGKLRPSVNGSSAKRSGSNKMSSLQVSRFQQSNSTEQKSTPNKSLQKFLKNSGNNQDKSLMSPILTSYDGFDSSPMDQNLSQETKNTSSVLQKKGVSPLDLS